MDRNMVPLILAVVSGLVGVFLIYSYVNKKELEVRKLQSVLYRQEQRQSQLQKELADLKSHQRVRTKVPVIVAVKDIRAGQFITSEMVQERYIPSEAKVSSAAGSMDAVIGKIAKADIVKGEQILLNRLISPEKLKKRNEVIEPGRRLVTVTVQQTGLFQFIRPGQKVDIVAMFNLPPNQIVKVGLFSDVQIKAINGRISYNLPPPKEVKGISRRTDEPKEQNVIRVNPDKGTITFALPPKEAAILYMASQFGRLEIYPRANLDPDRQKLPPITVDAVLQYAMPQIMAKAKAAMEQAKAKKEQSVMAMEVASPPPPRKIKIRRGSNLQTKELAPGKGAGGSGLSRKDLLDKIMENIPEPALDKGGGNVLTKEDIKQVIREVLDETKRESKEEKSTQNRSRGKRDDLDKALPPDIQKYISKGGVSL